MSYGAQAIIAHDQQLLNRVAACAASVGVGTGPDDHPVAWAHEQRWHLSAQPGWVTAYKYAIDSGDLNPGDNEGAVTDVMILSAVQLLNQPEEIG